MLRRCLWHWKHNAYRVVQLNESMYDTKIWVPMSSHIPPPKNKYTRKDRLVFQCSRHSGCSNKNSTAAAVGHRFNKPNKNDEYTKTFPRSNRCAGFCIHWNVCMYMHTYICSRLCVRVANKWCLLMHKIWLPWRNSITCSNTDIFECRHVFTNSSEYFHFVHLPSTFFA